MIYTIPTSGIHHLHPTKFLSWVSCSGWNKWNEWSFHMLVIINWGTWETYWCTSFLGIVYVSKHRIKKKVVSSPLRPDHSSSHFYSSQILLISMKTVYGVGVQLPLCCSATIPVWMSVFNFFCKVLLQGSNIIFGEPVPSLNRLLSWRYNSYSHTVPGQD